MDGRVQFGTCGWSDNSIKTCGRFYPSWVQTSEERLSIYSKTFPCVEVDSSTYAIPIPYNTKKWALSTPHGFKFHFKAFGLFTHQSAPLNTLPKKVRELVSSDVLPHDAVVTLQQLGDAGEKLAWDLFHAALAPVIACNKMGCVVFQFQLSFLDTVKNRSYVEHCRKMLSASIPMAVEFRNRAWFSRSASNNEDLCSWLNTLGVCLISADELEHETFQRDRHQTGLPAGAVRCIMPFSMSVTQPSYHYIRLHRRHGTKERILPAEEIQAWSLRLSEKLIPEVAGPVYFMWATDWEDAPIVNMRALCTALGPALCYDWKSQLSKIGVASKGSISSHFSAKRERESTEAHESEDLLGQQGCGMELKPEGHSSCVQRRDLVASGASEFISRRMTSMLLDIGLHVIEIILSLKSSLVDIKSLGCLSVTCKFLKNLSYSNWIWRERQVKHFWRTHEMKPEPCCDVRAFMTKSETLHANHYFQILRNLCLTDSQILPGLTIRVKHERCNILQTPLLSAPPVLP